MIEICVQIKIKKKLIVTASAVEDRYIRGIVYCDELGQELFSPVYPYIMSDRDLKSLERFVKEYQEELIKFYEMGKRLYFTHFLFGFDTILKEKFKERWYQKGVIVD